MARRRPGGKLFLNQWWLDSRRIYTSPGLSQLNKNHSSWYQTKLFIFRQGFTWATRLISFYGGGAWDWNVLGTSTMFLPDSMSKLIWEYTFFISSLAKLGICIEMGISVLLTDCHSILLSECFACILTFLHYVIKISFVPCLLKILHIYLHHGLYLMVFMLHILRESSNCQYASYCTHASWTVNYILWDQLNFCKYWRRWIKDRWLIRYTYTTSL